MENTSRVGGSYALRLFYTALDRNVIRTLTDFGNFYPAFSELFDFCKSMNKNARGIGVGKSPDPNYPEESLGIYRLAVDYPGSFMSRGNIGTIKEFHSYAKLVKLIKWDREKLQKLYDDFVFKHVISTPQSMTNRALMVFLDRLKRKS